MVHCNDNYIVEGAVGIIVYQLLLIIVIIIIKLDLKSIYILVYHFRPMYIDSTNADGKAGDLPVAELLRTSIEPLLMVSELLDLCQ